ncbi:MAG: hypothetical protein KBT68_05475 [bacterium]|nr:hypothetical protein [Candidatus Colisoma equi]
MVEEDGRQIELARAKADRRGAAVDNDAEGRPEVAHLAEGVHELVLLIALTAKYGGGLAEFDHAHGPTEGLCRPERSVKLRLVARALGALKEEDVFHLRKSIAKFHAQIYHKILPYKGVIC